MDHHRAGFMEDDYYSQSPDRNYGPDPSKLEVKKVSADPKKELTPEEMEKEKKKKPFKTLLVFVLSNFGIILVVLAYICGGAYLFQILEQHQEIQNCQNGEGELTNIVQDTRTEIFNYIYFNTTSDTDAANATGRVGPSVYNPQIQTWLYNFTSHVMQISSKYGYTGQNCETQSMWQYMSAMLFTFTVVSTIGYGHVTPKTWEGRIVCICYATLGIPLFLMSLARISGIMSELYRFVYSRVLCYPCLSYANNKKKHEDEEDEEEIVKSEEATEADHGQEVNNLDHFDGTKEAKDKVVDEEEEEYVGEEEVDRVSVPLVFVVGTFGAYIALGMLIFVNREGWQYVSALYFCYVSLSTVGFGDLVPGMNDISNNRLSDATVNLLIAFVYLFIGMALLAMCFALMQDEFKEKVELIVTKLGIRKAQEEEEDDDDSDDEDENDYGGAAAGVVGGTAAGVGMTAVTAGAYGAYQGRDVDSARSSLPPHYENSALDLRFERDPTVISVKPTMESYEEDLDFMPVTDRQMTHRETSHRQTQQRQGGGYSAQREQSALAFNREVTKLYQQKAENERQMSGNRNVNSRGFSNNAYDSNADYFGDL